MGEVSLESTTRGLIGSKYHLHLVLLAVGYGVYLQWTSLTVSCGLEGEIPAYKI